MSSQIKINNVESLIDGKSFEDIKVMFKELDIQVKDWKNDSEINTLYLLVVDTNVENFNQLQLECNGLIIEKDTNKIICMCQNKFQELQNDEEMNYLKTIYSTFKMEYCEDGTVIRVYCYKDIWRTATTRCLDGKYSYWGSKESFDSMFWNIFNESKSDVEMLDKNYTYQFIITHSENRIVVNHTKNNIIYINRINNQSKVEDYKNYFKNLNINILTEIETVHHLEDYYRPDKKGVIAKMFDETIKAFVYFKYDFKNYTIIKNIRGNTPCIRIRYLELLNTNDTKNLELLEYYYPEHHLEFCMAKHCLNNLYREVYNLYRNSHVKHNITIYEDHKLYRTLKQLHGLYKKQQIIITYDEVIKKVNSLNKNVLKKLLGWI